MDHLKIKTAQPTSSKLSTFLTLTVLTAIISLSNSCTSTYQPPPSLIDVIQAQSKLLSQLEMQRSDKTIIKQIAKSKSLTNSERHLIKSIAALKEANQVIKAYLVQQQTKGGNNDN